MLSEKTINEIKKYAKNISRDDNYINTSVELFCNVLKIAENDVKIENISKNIEDAYNAIKEGDDGPSLLLLNRFEQFMKAIYYIIDPEYFSKKGATITLNDCIVKTKLIPKNIFNNIKFSDKNARLDINDPNHPINDVDMEKSDYYPYMVAYWLRNDVCHHSSKISPKDYHKYYECILTTYFDVCNKFANLIVTFSMNILKYPESILKEYDNKGYNYIKTLQNLTANTDICNKYGVKDVDFIKLYNQNEFKIVKIIGYAGMGKSSILKYIQYNEMKKYINEKNTRKIPVIIPLILVDNINITVEDLVSEVLKIDIETAKTMIKENRLNLYFDGVNEIRITDKIEKSEFLKRLEEFINSYGKKNHVIVTDRDDNAISICNKETIYPKFIMQEFKDVEITEYVNNNCINDYKKEVLNIIKDLKDNNSTYYLKLKKPFYIYQFINYYMINKSIPESSAGITREYIKCLVDREEKEKKDLNARYIIGALKYVAKYKYVNPGNNNISVDENDLFMILNEYKQIILDDKDAYRVKDFTDLMIKMGLLKKDVFDKYSFADDSYFKVLGDNNG